MKQIYRLAKVANSTEDADMARFFKLFVKLGRVVSAISDDDKINQSYTERITDKLAELGIKYRIKKECVNSYACEYIYLDGKTLLNDIECINTLHRTGGINLMPADIKKIYSHG